MPTSSPSDRSRLLRIAAPMLLHALLFAVTGMLLASEFESVTLGLLGACMIFLLGTAVRSAVSGASARRR